MVIQLSSAIRRAGVVVIAGSVAAIAALVAGAQQPAPPCRCAAGLFGAGPCQPLNHCRPSRDSGCARHRALRPRLDRRSRSNYGSSPPSATRARRISAGDHGNDAVGLVQQCAAAGSERRFGRHDRLRDDDAFAQPGRARDDDRADQETAHRLSRPRAAHADRSGLHRGRGTGRRAQGAHQQDRAARLRHQLQRARHVRRVSEQVSRRTGQVFLPRSRAQGRRIRSRDRDPAGAVPRHDRRRPRRARAVQLGAARDVMPATSTSAT